MSTDWKDALAALGASLPPGDPEPEETPAYGSEEKPLKRTRLKIDVEKKGRGGKTATIIYGFDGHSDAQIADVARRLKQSLGIGGSSRGGEILLQGEARAKAADALRGMGYDVKG